MGKILFVANERFVYQSVNPLDLAELCAADGHVVAVAAPFTAESLQWNNDRGFQCIPLADEDAPLGNARFWMKTAEVAQTMRPDVVVGVNSVGFVAADLIRQAGFAKHLAYYALELAIPDELPQSLSARWQAMRARHAQLIITTGHDRADEMFRRFQLTDLPNVIANSPIKGPPTPSTELRDRLRARGVNARYVLSYTGSGGEHNRLIEAVHASRLWENDVVLALHPFGGSSDWRRVFRGAVEASAARSVVLPGIPGGRDVLLRYLSGADAGLVLYDHRSDTSLNMLWYTPNKIYDYMACGHPVVASDNPSLVNEVEGRGWGITCDPRDPQSIADAVDRVFSDHAAMSRRASALFKSESNYVVQSAATRDRLTTLADD